MSEKSSQILKSSHAWLESLYGMNIQDKDNTMA